MNNRELRIAAVIAEAIQELKEVPNGHLYAHVMGNVSWHEYNTVLAAPEAGRTGQGGVQSLDVDRTEDGGRIMTRITLTRQSATEVDVTIDDGWTVTTNQYGWIIEDGENIMTILGTMDFESGIVHVLFMGPANDLKAVTVRGVEDFAYAIKEGIELVTHDWNPRPTIIIACPDCGGDLGGSAPACLDCQLISAMKNGE